MKVLVIPDVHLKPEMFSRASALMEKGAAEKAVCLMDIPDSWGQELNIDLYIRTYDAAIKFAEDCPDTLWCLGNHDLSYIWSEWETGFSITALETVCKKSRELEAAMKQEGQLAYLQRIDDVLFSHGGLAEKFVREYVPGEDFDDIDKVISKVNGFGREIMWNDLSPLWLRPQYYGTAMYKKDVLLQVVGHTPVEGIIKEGNLISCDVFSRRRDGSQVGTCEFAVIDTKTGNYEAIKA